MWIFFVIGATSLCGIIAKIIQGVNFKFYHRMLCVTCGLHEV